MKWIAVDRENEQVFGPFDSKDDARAYCFEIDQRDGVVSDDDTPKNYDANGAVYYVEVITPDPQDLRDAFATRKDYEDGRIVYEESAK